MKLKPKHRLLFSLELYLLDRYVKEIYMKNNNENNGDIVIILVYNNSGKNIK